MNTSKVGITDVDFHFYGKTLRESPQSVIKLDNNFDILYFCRDEKTKEQLIESRMPVSDSQLKLLQDWRLLNKKKDQFKTNFPIFTAEKTGFVRDLTVKAAHNIGIKIEEDMFNLMALLARREMAGSVYIIFFSYVLDYLLWHYLDGTKQIKEEEITGEKPFWTGFLYAVYPKRKAYYGTVGLSEENITLRINWNGHVQNLIQKLPDKFDTYINFFKAIIPTLRINNDEAIEKYKALGLVNSKGELTIPIIDENSDSHPLKELSHNMARKIAREIYANFNLSELRRVLNLDDISQGLVAITHELIWDILGYFEDKKILTKPSVFDETVTSEIERIRDLMFIVKG